MEQCDRELCWLPVKKLLGGQPFPPREQDPPLDFLLSSVRLHGILSPLLVRSWQGELQVVCGYRRLLAAHRAGIEKVPVMVAQIEDVRAIRYYLSENMCRQTLSDGSRESVLKLLKELRDEVDVGLAGAADEIIDRAKHHRGWKEEEEEPPSVSSTAVEAPTAGVIDPALEGERGSDLVLRQSSRATVVASLIEKTEKLFQPVRARRCVEMSLAEEIVDELLAFPEAEMPLTLEELYDGNETPAGWLVRHSLLVASLNVALIPSDFAVHRARIYALGGLLHDVGIIFLERLCANESKVLSGEQRRELQSHTRIGQALISVAGKEYVEVALVARDHHERLDGSGYPGGLQGDQIGRLVRLTALSESYASIIGVRPHRVAQNPERALERLARDTETGLYDASLFSVLQLVCATQVRRSRRQGRERARGFRAARKKKSLALDFY